MVRSTRFWAIAVVLSVKMLVYFYETVMYARAFTECAESGLRTRGLARTRECAWSQVCDISSRRRAFGSDVIVTTAMGARFRLGAPVDRSTMRDPDLAFKIADIERYRRFCQNTEDLFRSC